MCANSTPTTTSSSPFAASGRAFFSRFTNPLKSRARNLTDFYIQPDEPHRQYTPGDLVKGTVVLTVVKPVRLTHLTVCLHGFVRVFKNANGANEPLPIDAALTTSSNPRKSQYFGNGHASLFQDEQTLCGEGRLEPSVYRFNFELEFPTKGLPTSIDFERGTISYMITATVTRPTSIAATSSCDKKLSLVETVDIGPMNPPRPRTISLEPISRRTKRKKAVTTKESLSPMITKDPEAGSDATRAPGSPAPDESVSQCGTADHNADPRTPTSSDVHSITSADSTASGSTSFRLGPVPSSVKSARESQQGSLKSSIPTKTITATIELLKSGCLPGDNLPLKISIKHTKAIKSMHGIIITLYRQGRIDSAPPLSLFTDLKGKAAERMKHEEYYPKSKTGLGGLSLSSAGSSSVFRKDLAQTFAPLLVDPTNLTAVVTASVRVPEDVFPTIKGVPGEMISFKYHVEVVVDLGGKLAGQQRHLPRVGAVTLPSNYGNSGTSSNANMLAAWGGSIVDTDHIRREKSVVVCLFDIVVGSLDSARKRGKGSVIGKQQLNGWVEEAPIANPSLHDPIYEEPTMPSAGDVQAQHDGNHDGQYQEYYGNEGYYEDYDWYPERNPPSHDHILVPQPDVHDSSLTDKERARLAEERLLPSQPPQDFEGPSSSRTVVPRSALSAPSAPPEEMEEEEDLYNAEDAAPHGLSGQFPSLNEANRSSELQSPSAPPPESFGPAASSNPTEDKQELERQRMLGEASAPTEVIRDGDDNAGEASSTAQQEPSAPILGEEEEYGSGRFAVAGPSSLGESLPRYER